MCADRNSGGTAPRAPSCPAPRRGDSRPDREVPVDGIALRGGVVGSQSEGGLLNLISIEPTWRGQERRWVQERVCRRRSPRRSPQRAQREDAGHSIDGNAFAVCPPWFVVSRHPRRRRAAGIGRIPFAGFGHRSTGPRAPVFRFSSCQVPPVEGIRAPGRRPAWSGARRALARPAFLPRSISGGVERHECAVMPTACVGTVIEKRNVPRLGLRNSRSGHRRSVRFR